MKYGSFSKSGLEYVICTPETPRPWINYLTNETYCSIISQCAGGYSFYKDCRTNRITRWAPENWHFDRPGKYIFMREGTKAWSLTYQPLRVKPQKYECRHGLGYTTIAAVNNGVHSEVTYFVPEHDSCEVWLVKISNQTKKEKKLELYPYVEFLIGDYHEEIRYRNIMNLYTRVWFDKGHKAVFAKKTAQWQGMNIQPFDSLIYFSSSLAVKGCCTQKDAFLGRYNSEERPDAVLEGRFKNFPLCSGEDGIGAFKHTVTLKPGETKEFSVVLGQTPDIPGIEHATDSNQVFHLSEQPRRVLVVGGGYIAVEFASIFHGLGSQTSLLYRGDLFLRGFDQAVRLHLRDELSRKG
ncbi:MAG TPA: FAD-dependent oxidoreductase, partial [Candidatus Omnitrophota bacterium]|nr:FAD-dependent oxidoreductase [Candidatus Omnitrophota bacterium]